MESTAILTADILDILFEGRNKEYGAYDLRRTYRKRLTVAMTVMLSALLLLTIGFVFAGDEKQNAKQVILPPDLELQRIQQEQPVEPPPPPPPPKQPEPPKVEMSKFTPPKIVADNEVKKEDMPPETDKLDDTKIGTMNQEGEKDLDIVAPPVNDGNRNVVVAPQKEEEDWNRTFTKVEIPSMYPGGSPAWQRFLNRNLRFDPVDGIQGTVVVQFIVDKEGNVSEVQAISGPEELRAESVRVIRKSGKWTPAVQNGHQVKSVQKQPIVFRIDDQQ